MKYCLRFSVIDSDEFQSPFTQSNGSKQVKPKNGMGKPANCSHFPVEMQKKEPGTR
jgi:hypothetical protein